MPSVWRILAAEVCQVVYCTGVLYRLYAVCMPSVCKMVYVPVLLLRWDNLTIIIIQNEVTNNNDNIYWLINKLGKRIFGFESGYGFKN